MPKRQIELLLLENVENLGIVGDVVRVKPGYARNFLLPHGLAEAPTAEKIEALKEARAAAQAELDRLRGEREQLIERLEDVHIELIRAANEQGVLYGSVTQRDIADALNEAGYGVDTSAIRLSSAIRRTGDHHVLVQFEKDLKAEIEVTVNPDRPAEELLDEQGDEEGEGQAEGEGERAEARGEPTATA